MTAPETMAMNCPSEETLAAFVDGRLDRESRQRVMAHAVSCGSCRDTLIVAAEWQEATIGEEQDPIRLPTQSRFLRFGAMAAAAVIVVGSAYFWQTSRSSAVGKLVKANEALQERPILARSSMPLDWRPPTQAVRSETSKPESLDLLIATKEIADIVKRDGSIENIRALAVANLMRRQPDEAIASLETALLEQSRETEIGRAIAKSRDAALLVDLSAAYLTRARRSDQSQDAAFAAEAASRAYSLEKTPAAAWNRALAFEELNLDDQAIGAWRDFLAMDSTSQWANEARDRMSMLSRLPIGSWDQDKRELDSPSLTSHKVMALSRLYPRETASHAEGLLLQWAGSRPEAASDSLQRLRLIGEALAEETGDRFILDCVQKIATARNDSELAEIKNGLRRLTVGRLAADLVEADEHFAAAQESLGWPFSELVSVDRVRNAHARNEFAIAATIAKQAPHPTAVRYPIIVSRRGWLAGLCLVEMGQVHQALFEYRSALEAAETIRDADSAAALHALIAQSLSLLGRNSEAWHYRAGGFELARKSANPKRLGYVLAEANVAAVDEDFYELSTLFTRVATLDAHASRPIVVGSMMWSARRLHAIGRFSDARNEITRARSLLGGIESKESRERSTALIDLAEGAALAEADPRQALFHLNRALAFFERTNENIEVAQALEARARSYNALSEGTSAAADLRRALSMIESQRDAMADPVLRASYMETRGRLFERMVSAALSHDDVEGAFVLADRSRLGFLSDESASPWTASRIQSALGSDVALLEFYSLDDRLLVWIVSPRSVEQLTIEVARDQLAYAARDLSAAMIGNDAPRFDRQAAKLYDLLIRPVADRVTWARRLIVIPDSHIKSVPFSALYDLRRGRWLFEDHEIVLSPSAAIYAHASSRRTPASREPRVAVFANAEVKGKLFPTLDRLDWAEAEALDVHAKMKKSDVFIGAAADRDRFLRAMESYDLIHFDGHAVLHLKDPELSALLLNDANGETVPLHPRDIRETRAHAGSAVVLSACDTAAVGARHHNGGGSLAESFLAAGVSTVIGSLAPVDDGGAAELMAAFYVALSRQLPYAAALRSAKLEIAAKQRAGHVRERSWLSYEVIGSSDG